MTTPHNEPPPEPSDADRPTVMLLGTGEFCRELSTALRRLGAHVIVAGQEPGANVPADESLLLDLTDADEVGGAIRRLRPHFVVTASDAVPPDALTAVAASGIAEFVPSARCARLTADREGMRRLAADELGLPTAPFWFAGSIDELRAIADHAGYPLRVQPVAAVGGEGQSVVLLPGDLEQAWQRAVSTGGRSRVLAETLVEIDFHVTLLTIRGEGPSGPTLDFCQPIGHGEAIGDVQESWQPQDLSPAALDAAKSIAARVVKALGGRGLFGVELMVRGDEVYFCDVTARPFESGLVTVRTQRLSEFELQARAILGLSTDTIMISPGAAEVIYAGVDGAGQRPRGGAALGDALRTTESDVRVFARDESGARRPLGAAVVTAADVTTARGRARDVSAALRRLW
ncbi:formate-dependent phosphoribosylglycinamide formyltransferase [Candidatus Mycobacterium wuenschmannii]|uniref:Formate-dependent phosphoribosylglycinamide formyltransferase n=1 Tax=Candidatus Mycobacterium wuenschmannii TaxID=3027808 RepID=A0ABY8VUJ8_9MYCO|nr:formate-dependent phosphoribosylglycinamide formyltransferase [Candidatus Mycobacterium wuenschmannii]WIM87182.1 formate-dependent phosphoribosylglycinamide formyltransferase [Candidatus Mycobacterium wuenschmannii]